MFAVILACSLFTYAVAGGGYATGPSVVPNAEPQGYAQTQAHVQAEPQVQVAQQTYVSPLIKDFNSAYPL